jgi:hypothetical protein
MTITPETKDQWIAQLRKKVYDLAAEKEALKKEVQNLHRIIYGEGFYFPKEWGLTATGISIISRLVLAQGRAIHRIDFLNRYGENMASNTVTAYIYSLRKIADKHAPWIVIRNSSSLGYYIDPEICAEIKRLYYKQHGI